MADNNEVLLLLGEIRGDIGEIRGEMTGINERLKKVDEMDKRLRAVEVKAAKNGAISGGAVSVGIALLIEGGKAWLKHN